MPATAHDLRDWFRRLKDASRLSYAEIASAIGEEERNVKRWMTVGGEPVIPRGDVVLRLLSTLGVTFNPPAPASVLALNAQIGELRTLLESADDLIDRATEADAESAARSLAQDRELLRGLEATVGDLGQKMAEGFAHLAAAIDELSGRLPAQAPGSPPRKAAGRRRQ